MATFLLPKLKNISCVVLILSENKVCPFHDLINYKPSLKTGLIMPPKKANRKGSKKCFSKKRRRYPIEVEEEHSAADVTKKRRRDPIEVEEGNSGGDVTKKRRRDPIEVEEEHSAGEVIEVEGGPEKKER